MRDFQQNHEVKARFSLITNITPHSFLVNRRQLLGNKFIERCLVVYHALTEEEISEANLRSEDAVIRKIGFDGNRGHALVCGFKIKCLLFPISGRFSARTVRKWISWFFGVAIFLNGYKPA